MQFKSYLILLIFLAEALIKDDEIRFHDDIPFIDITFSNGVKDSLVLKNPIQAKNLKWKEQLHVIFLVILRMKVQPVFLSLVVMVEMIYTLQSIQKIV